MGLGKKESTQSQTQQVNQVSEPWAAQQPYLKDLFARAQSNANNLPEYFKGSTVAQRSQDTTSALNLMRQGAQSMQPGIDQTMATALWNMGAGRDMANNPYLQSAITAATNPVVDQFMSVGGPLEQIRSSFTARNSGGSGTREGVAAGIAQGQLGRTLADMSSRMTMDAYQQAQQQALQTMGMMPQFLQMQMMPGQALGQVGAANDAYAQTLINADVDRWNFNQNRQNDALARYAQLISGNYGGTTSGTTTNTVPGPTKSPLQQGLGGALSGAMLGSMMGGPMAPFAIGGGLLGLFG